MTNRTERVMNQLDELADHVERIALIIADGKSHKTPQLDARFLVLAADALRSLGGQMTELAKLGHALKGSPETQETNDG